MKNPNGPAEELIDDWHDAQADQEAKRLLGEATCSAVIVPSTDAQWLAHYKRDHRRLLDKLKDTQGWIWVALDALEEIRIESMKDHRHANAVSRARVALDRAMMSKSGKRACTPRPIC